MANNREISQFAGLVTVNDSTNAVTIGSTLNIGAGASISMNTDGTSSFGGNLLIGGTLPANPNISLNADGSAEFVDNIGSGPLLPSGGIGVRLNANGSIGIRNDIGFTSPVLQVFRSGTTAGDRTILLNNDGTSQFEQTMLIGGTLPSSPNITLNENGLITATADTNGNAYALKNSSIIYRHGIDGSNEYNIYGSINPTLGVVLTPSGTSWVARSDERVKEDLQPITNGLEKVGSLRAVTGKYVDDSSGKKRPFLIAQDVQAVLPEAVEEKDDNQKTLLLSYTEVIPLLVSALHDAKDRIETLEAEVTALKGA